MNLILYLRELWGRRLLAAAAIALAAAVALVAIYRVELLPPGLEQRADVEARGSIGLLVDSASSPIADARRDLGGLTARAAVFAQLISGGRVIGEIARRSGLRPGRIDVRGPQPLGGGTMAPLQPPPRVHAYGIEVVQQPELPIIEVLTRAPSVAEARAMAAAAPAAIRRLVESVQDTQETPAAKQVEFRVLGPPRAAAVDDAPGKKAALAIFALLATLGLLAILAAPRLRAAWRRGGEPPGPPVGLLVRSDGAERRMPRPRASAGGSAGAPGRRR